MDLVAARATVAAPTPIRPDQLQSASLTAVVLAGLASADLEWTPGATPRSLLGILERHSTRSGVSILSPPFLQTVSEDAAEVDVPGCVRFRVEFGLIRDSVAEFRLPKSALRIVPTSNGWTLGPGRLQGEDGGAISFVPRQRDVIAEVARVGGANFVLSPEVRGDVDEYPKRPWRNGLEAELMKEGSCAVYEASGILRFGERKRITRLKASTTTSDVVPPDSSPRVSVDVWETDFRRTALRVAQSGGVSLEFSPDVKGKVTARLVDVPWRDALEALATTSGFALSVTPSRGLLMSMAPYPPPTPLEPLFFENGDLPNGWGLHGALGRPSPWWGVSDHEIDYLLTAGSGIKGVSRTDISEVYRREVLENNNHRATFLLLSFRTDSTAGEVEARLGASEMWTRGTKHVVLRRGPILAVGLWIQGDDPAPFDALVAKLRERMGLNGK